MHPYQILSTRKCVSTMEDARHAMQKGWSHGTVCRTASQTAGRGRIPGRVWQDDGKGALLFTLILARKQIKIGFPLTQVLALSLCRWLENIYKLKPAIKWPNDVRVNGRKIAGILVETKGEFYLAGIGINLRSMSFEGKLGTLSTSLEELIGEEAFSLHYNSELTGLLGFIHKNISRPQDIEEVNVRLEKAGQEMRLIEGMGSKIQSHRVMVRKIQKDGALVVERNQQEISTIYSGELEEIEKKT